MKIGVDLMGGDNPPEALLQILRTLPPHIQVVPIGLPEYAASDFDYVSAPTFITMDEAPLSALRRKKQCSISVGLRLLKEKKIDALISAGNTGALVSASKMILGTQPGILRPALLALMPTKKDPIVVLDVGANVQAKASHLVQFAHLGAAFCHSRGIQNPSVGLLNIGEEPIKGTSELRLAYQKLMNLPHPPFQFVGNIEGKSVFDGDVNVLVTDGFTGNIFLKTAEGTASLIMHRLGPLVPLREHHNLNPQTGALIAGVNGTVIKCHGYAPPQAFFNAILSIKN